ncbi:hypothetical protein [Altererythrobacter sp. MF3-039]|uniref:hypothetical protein n=1 Tax=Altererythrobacter sp. MF3-039 TaxID=3252901 RepID=UPI00390C92EF
MSKLSMAALMIAAALIVLAVILDLPFVRGGSGVFLLAGLAYAYVVAKREVELLTYAVKNRDDVYELEDVYEDEAEQIAVHVPVVSRPANMQPMRARPVG